MKLSLLTVTADAAGAIATAIATAAEPATMAPAVRPSLVNIIDSPYLLNRCFIENANIYRPVGSLSRALTDRLRAAALRAGSNLAPLFPRWLGCKRTVFSPAIASHLHRSPRRVVQGLL